MPTISSAALDVNAFHYERTIFGVTVRDVAKTPSENPESSGIQRQTSTTIGAVAALAGVSAGTVSKALNGRPHLRAETVDRVRRAAQELGYRPDMLARRRPANRSFTVGLITTDSFGRFSIPVMLGAQDALSAGQVAVFMCDTRDDPVREQHYLGALLERRVDGIIIAGRRSDLRPSLGRDLPVPVIYAMTESVDPEDLSLIPDNDQGGRLAIRHLVATGRRRIAHITGPERFRAVRQRITGAVDELQQAGLSLAGGQPLAGEWTEQWGRQATRMLLRSNPDIDAIFCGSDLLGRGVADSLRDLGRRVPDDVALVGFDNWALISTGNRPPLTTIDMNLEDMGRLAAESLLSAIDGHPERGTRLLECRLVVRESTDTPPERVFDPPRGC